MTEIVKDAASLLAVSGFIVMTAFWVGAL